MDIQDLDWGIVALAVISTYVVASLDTVRKLHPVLENRMYFQASIWFILSLISRVLVVLPFWPDFIDPSYVTDTFIMLTISSLLVGLAIVVRESKPIVSRFPLALAFTPFMLVPAHLLVSHTFVLKQILYDIYAFGGIIVGLLIYGLKTSTDRRYQFVLVGIILFAVSLTLKWFPIPRSIAPWIHWSLVATSLIVTTRSYKSIIRQIYSN